MNSMTKTPMPEQDAAIRATNFKEVALGYTVQMAQDEAARCLQCKNAPCVSGCPVNVPIRDFIAQIRQGDYAGAYATIRSRMACPPSADASAPRKPSARANVSAASRANLWVLAGWNALWPTGPWSMAPPCPSIHPPRESVPQ